MTDCVCLNKSNGIYIIHTFIKLLIVYFLTHHFLNSVELNVCRNEWIWMFTCWMFFLLLLLLFKNYIHIEKTGLISLFFYKLHYILYTNDLVHPIPFFVSCSFPSPSLKLNLFPLTFFFLFDNGQLKEVKNKKIMRQTAHERYWSLIQEDRKHCESENKYMYII